jgi:hypothetical protein
VSCAREMDSLSSLECSSLCEHLSPPECGYSAT